MSKNERDLDCTITFQTESILEKFLVRFDELGIDCNDRLEVFDGAHTHGRPVVSSNSSYLIRSAWHTDSNIFCKLQSTLKVVVSA